MNSVAFPDLPQWSEQHCIPNLINIAEWLHFVCNVISIVFLDLPQWSEQHCIP